MTDTEILNWLDDNIGNWSAYGIYDCHLAFDGGDPLPLREVVARTAGKSEAREASDIERLRAARVEVEIQREAVTAEMSERGRQGRLWSNGQCAAWPDYEKAVAALETLREELGT